MTFGEKIKLCRKVFNITQEELSVRLGTSKQVISRYEAGIRIPKLTVAQKYADAFKIPLSFLIDTSVEFSIWDDETYFEDYYRSSDLDRVRIVEKLGLDPRVASDYGNLLSENSFFTKKSEVLSSATLEIMDMLSDMTPEELTLVKARISKIKESR